LVRIIHDPRDEPDRNPGAEVFALQQDFQARLADETLRYLRSLRGLLGPASPGTVLRPQPDLVLRAEAPPGGVGEISFEVENRQEVHVIATPMLTPLVRADGTTWFPDAVAVPASTLVAPGAVGHLRMIVNVPDEADAGQYDGALVLLGMKGAVVQVSFTVTSARVQARRPRRAQPAPTAKAAAPRRSNGRVRAQPRSAQPTLGQPIVGRPTSGSATSGRSTSHRSTSGRSTSGGSTSGRSTSGSATSGRTTSGRSTSGSATSGRGAAGRKQTTAKETAKKRAPAKKATRRDGERA
jgi:hypothetical protein